MLRLTGPNVDGVRSAVIRVGSQELNVFSRPELVSFGAEAGVGMDHFCLAVEASFGPGCSCAWARGASA